MSDNKKTTTYVPKSSARARETKIGQVINLSFEATELGKFVRAHKNQKGYINLSLIPRKEQGKFGETHSIVLDTFEPKAAEVKPKKKLDQPDQNDAVDEDIPF